MTETLAQDHRSGLWYRQGSYDQNTIRAVKDYHELRIGAADITLDIGAHLGAFSNYAAGCGATVVSYEPAPSSFALLSKNLGTVDRVTLHNAAVVGHYNDEINFYLNTGMNHGLNSSVERHGREIVTVNAENILKVLKHVKPTVVKIDCEGAEYELFEAMLGDVGLPLWKDRVRAFAVEWHFSRKGWREIAKRRHQELLELGFSEAKAPKLTGKSWATVAVYRREAA